MTSATLSRVGALGKLTGVRIAMTTRALTVRGPKHDSRTAEALCWRSSGRLWVTAGAGHRAVTTHEWISSLRVLFDGEGRALEATLVVTRGAIDRLARESRLPSMGVSVT